ncbi:hypothetical protein Cob_v003459 [Colletotrichum orbiculare MAFF 240422]|uniref:Fungal N-terminal domain-containing protein n=1 Tax=Colletotrichum orbiculare (strain 104-T / ATCC 96160 / CBS 514.97 / LARS 414 / MAFF 240422) TaxID=1213857 RepID=A0A484G0S0_COLOR|nr:hypothetical protein Cob_v003459 [Colletotrichum orbiculare MAFF 240422]
MAEVIGSLAAVIQLVSCASNFARELRKFSRTVGPLSDEAQKCAIQAKNFSYALEALNLRRQSGLMEAVENMGLEIKTLQANMKSLIKTMEWQAAEKIQPQTDPGLYRHSRSLMRSRRTLLRLGKSMVDTGGVPSKGSRSPHSRRSSGGMSSSMPSSPTPDRPVNPVHGDHSNNYTHWTSTTTNSAKSTAPKISETVQVASKVIVIDPNRLETSTTGYVRSDSGEMRHTTAVQLESIDGAIISILKAKELGLDVEEYDNDEEVWIAFGDSTSNKSVGRAVLNWRQRSRTVNNLTGDHGKTESM